ncbi:GNAT family N-acetyltransferase [Lapidilactobacillus bayanensis]|uniref:GNAT family N-acetyltransferase n=1 Tax=Lapidilactobacillus bayanensis TaxID=2485998 RepID=UPI000F771654|nr:GNAT family N-acetyltransferase [Lapidilactobacillus bayanensis]
MEKFEKYHPIMTPHFTFDWLTTARLNHSTELIRAVEKQPDLTTAQAAEHISQLMLKIMRNQELTWGIFKRPQKTLIGLTSLANLQEHTKTAELSLYLPPNLSELEQTELLTRLVTFVFAELDFNETILATNQTTISPQVLTDLGFSKPDKTGNWLIERAVSLKTSL